MTQEHEIVPPAPVTQADRIFARFGGVRKLCLALDAIGRRKHITALYRWNHTRAMGGTDGMVPTRTLVDVIAAARHEGIILTPEDMSPQRSVLIDSVYAADADADAATAHAVRAAARAHVAATKEREKRLKRPVSE